MSDGKSHLNRFNNMKRYSDYKKSGNKDNHLSDDEMKNVKWTRYKIVVPTYEDKKEIMDTMRYFHDEMYDSDLITPNQMAHEYLGGDNIIVDVELFNNLNK
jgi:hypothetical protein